MKIYLDEYKVVEGCNPACVIDMATLTASFNPGCSGGAVYPE